MDQPTIIYSHIIIMAGPIIYYMVSPFEHNLKNMRLHDFLRVTYYVNLPHKITVLYYVKSNLNQ